MKRLKITHFSQDPGHCAIASCAAVTNYYNSNIDYDYVKNFTHKKITKNTNEGLESSEMCMLLNFLGFKKVTLISSDLMFVDYLWSKYGKRKMIASFEESLRTKKDKEERQVIKKLYKWLSQKGYKNFVKIDYHFGRLIRKALKKKIPIIVTFKWTTLMEFPKIGDNKQIDPINGSSEIHAVVANGFDEKGIWIVDSHHEHYKYKRKKYRRGFYKIPWEDLMVCVEDVFIPEDYQNK